MKTKAIFKLYLIDGKKTYSSFEHSGNISKEEVIRRFFQQNIIKEDCDDMNTNVKPLSKDQLYIFKSSII